ncbi:ribose-phosphate pyrophosphokinase [bacterium]|nr:ribose-phosphate pyrophosphokinase [bacterium]
MQNNPIKIFSGSSHPQLATEIAKHLHVKLSPMHISKFACGEIYAKPVDSVRGGDVFVVQTATSNVNEDLIELFIMLDAFKRSFAGKIHVIMPNYGYARQDRVATPREPISAKLMANLISAAGADHLITMVLHSDQEQGFFDFPVDNLYSRKFFADYFKKKKLKNLVVVSPDAGGAKKAKKFADIIGAELAIIHKSRPRANVSQVMHLVGDVKGKRCIIYDDMIDTAGSVCNAAKALKKHGAHKDIYLAATHAVFSDPAVKRLSAEGFKEVVVTNSIPVPKEKRFKGLKVLSIAPLLAKIIKNVHSSKSVSTVFNT